MRKISYRFVYNRKKSLNDRGTALVQVEAYLNKKKVYFSTHVYLRPEQWDVKRKIIKEHPNQDALNGMLNEFIIELEKKRIKFVEARKDNNLKPHKRRVQIEHRCFIFRVCT